MGTWKYLWHGIFCVLLGHIYSQSSDNTTNIPTATSEESTNETVTKETNTQQAVKSSSNGTTLNLVTATDLTQSSVHSTAQRPSTDTEKTALPVSTVILDSTTVASAVTSHFTSNISPQTEVSQMTSTISTVPNTESVPTGTTKSDKTDTKSNTPTAFKDNFFSTATNPMTHLSTTAQTAGETSSNSPATTAFSTETTLPVSTTSKVDSTFTLNPLQTQFSTSFSSSPVSKNASQVSEQTASVSVSGHGPTATNNPSTEEKSFGTSVTITESSLGLTTTIAELSTFTIEPNTQESVTSSSNGTTQNLVTATDLSHSSVHLTAERPSTDTEKSALPVSTVLPESTTVASAVTSHFTSKISPQTEVSQMTSTISTVPNTERLPTGTTSSDKTDTESNSPPAFTDKFSSTATNPMTHLITTVQTAGETSSISPGTTAFSTTTTLPVSTTSRVDSTFTLNPLQTQFSTSFSSSPVSKNASQVSEQTASVSVSAHGPTATNNPSTEETSSGTYVTITESSLGLTTTIAELSTVTIEPNTQESVTSSSIRTTLNLLTATDLSHSSLHSTTERTSTVTGKTALPVSTVLPDSTSVASAVTSHFTSNISPQTEVSQMTSTISTVPNTERLPTGNTSSDKTDTESNSPPAFTDQFSSTGTNPMTHPSTAAQTPAETPSNSPVTTAFSTETTLPASTTSRVDGTFTLNPLETEFSTSFSSSPVSKTASHVSEQTASVGVSGNGPTATNNPSTEETSPGTSVTITQSSLGLITTIAELSTVTNESNTQQAITSSSNGTTLNLVTATDLSHSSVHSTAERPSTDTEKSALPVSTVLPESTIVASAVTSHFTSKISPQTEVSQMTSTISTVPNTERLPTGTTSSDKTDTESNSPPAFTDKFSSTATSPMTHLITTVQTAGETSSNSPATTAFSTETTLPVSTTSRVDSTFTLNPLQTQFSTSFSSSPVSKNASQVSEQTASVSVSGHGPTATNNPSTEEKSFGTSVTITDSSRGLTTTIAELSTVTIEPNTQESVTSSSNGTTLNLVTATDLSHSSVHSTAERPSTDTEKSALPVSTVLPESTTVASAVTSHFTSKISPQTEVSQMTSTISTVPNTERLPTGTTSSVKTDTESNSPPAFTDKFSSTATNPMTHLITTVQTAGETSSNSPATTAFSTETTLPVSTTSRVDSTFTLNPLQTQFSTSFSSSLVSKNASQVSEQTASVSVSAHGPTATNNPSTEETSSGTSVTITESSLGLTTTIAELSTVTIEPNTQESVTSSSIRTTLNLLTATDLSHSSLHSTTERPSTVTGKTALPVSTVLPDSTSVASAVTSHFTSNISPQTEVSQMTSTISTVPNTERLPTGNTSSDKTDTESNSPPAFTDQFSSTGTNPMTHPSTAAQTPAETPSNSPVTTAFSTETTLPASTTSRVDGTFTLNPLETEFSTSFSPSPVSKTASHVSEQTASVGVSGNGPTATNNPSTEETSPGTSVTITQSSLGLITTIAELSTVTNESNTQQAITSSSNGTTLNLVTATDLSHSSVHSTAERPSTDTEKSALPVSTVLPESTIVASAVTSHFTSKISPQTEVSQMTSTISTVPNTERLPTGTTSSDKTDTESNSPPAFTNKFSSTATSPMTHLITTVQTAGETSSNSPATTAFSTETTLPVSTTNRVDSTFTLNPLQTQFSTSFSSSPVSKNASQVSEQTASVSVSGHGPTATNNPSTEEKSFGTSVTITESSLGLTTTIAELSTVTIEPNTQESVTSSSNGTTLNLVTATDLSHSSVHSTAERPSTDTEKSALPVSTVPPESTTVASAVTSHFTSKISPQTEVSQMTSTISTVPNTERLPTGTTSSDKTDTESNSPPAFTDKFSSTATNPMTHLITTVQTAGETSSNSPATTAFSTETTLPVSTTSRVDGTFTLNPLETQFSTSFSSSPVSMNASQVSEQTASVGVSGHGPTATNNPSTEETSSGTYVTITEPSLGLTTTIAELSTVTIEPNTQESVTSSSIRTTLNLVTATDLSHSSLHSTTERPSTVTGKTALPVSTVLPDSTSVASAVTSHFTSNISPQTEVSQMTSTISTVPNTERLPTGNTSSDKTDTESNSPPAFTDQFSSTGTNPMTHPSTAAQTPEETSSNSPVTTAFSTETTLPASTTSRVDGTFTLNPLETEFSTSFSSSTVPKTASHVSEQTASVGVSGNGPTATNNPSTEETSFGTSVTITESSLGLMTTIAELSTVTNEPNTQQAITSSSNGTTLNLVTATDLSHSSVHLTAERPSTDTEKSALPVSTVLPESTTVASAVTSHFTSKISPQTEVSQMTSTISTVPNTERLPTGTTSSVKTDTESNSPPAFTDKFSSTSTNPMTHLITTVQTAGETSSISPGTTAFSTETTLPVSTTSRVDSTFTLNPLQTQFSTSFSSSPVSKNASQVSEQTASVSVSGHGPTATNNPSTEEKSFGTSVTITESSLGLTTTIAELSTVTIEPNTQESVTSSSNGTTLNLVTATDLSHSSVHSTAERPSTDTEKSALPVSTVLPESTTVASAVTSHFTSKISPQTEVSQMTSTISTVPNTERLPTGTTSSVKTDTESNSPPAFTNKFSSTATSPMTHLITTVQTAGETSSNSPATTAFSTETTLPVSTTNRVDSTFTLNPLQTQFSTSFSSSPVSKNASQVSEQTASVSVSGHGPTATNNPSTEEKSFGTSVTITESSLGLTTTIAELSTVTIEPNTQESVTSSSNGTTLNLVTATDLSHSSVHSTAERPSTDTEKSALPVSTVPPESTTVASAVTSHFTSKISPQTEVSQMTSTISTVPNTERLPTGTTSSDKTDTESNSPPAFTDKFSSTATNPMTHLITTVQTAGETSSNSPATTAFSTETTLPVSTTSRVDGTFTLNPLETQFSTSFSSSPVSMNASQVSEQTASVGVSGHGPTATNNPSTEETSSGTYVTITEPSLGLTTTIAELSTVTIEPNTQESVTSSSIRTTLNLVTATDLSHSSLHSTTERPSTVTGKTALPVSTVLPDSTSVASAVTSHFTSNISPQTEVSQMTSTISTVPNTERLPTGNTSSDKTDTESNSPPAFTDQFSSTGTNPMTHPSTAAQTPEETSSNSPVTTAFSTETTLPASTTSRVDGTFTLNPLETEFSTSFSSSTVPKTASHVSEQTASVGVSGNGPTATNNPSTEETSSGTSVTITESSLGLMTTIAELSTVTNEPNTQQAITSSSNGTTLNLVTATDLSHSSVHLTAERPSTDTEKSALPVSTVLPESTTVASAVTSHFTSKISPQTEVSQMTSTISTVPNTERLPTGTTSSVKTDTESNSPPAFTDKFSSTATNPMTHLITTVQTAGETSSISPGTTAFSTETTLPVSTTSRVDSTFTLNPLQTQFSTSFSSSPVSKNASQVSEQTASVSVSGHGPTATNNPSTEEKSFGTSVTITESSLGLTTTIAELSTVTIEPNTQESVTSSSNGTTLNLVTATDLSHSSVHSTAERPSTDTEKSALPVSTVLPESTTVASAVTSHFTSKISPQTEVSQMTSTISTVPNTERLPTGTTSSVKTDTESNSPPAFTNKFSSTATNPMTHLITTVQTAGETSSNSPATIAFSTETTLPVSTTSRVDGTFTLNPLETQFSTSFSSSPVSMNASQVSEQTASVGVSGHGPTATNNPSTEETSSGTYVTITEPGLGLTTTIAELSTVTIEPNTQESVTSSSIRTTLNLVTATDLSHSSLHSTTERPSTVTGKTALPVSTVLPDSTSVASAVTSHFTSNISPQTEVSQMTSTISTVPNTERLPTGNTSSDKTDTESNSPPAFTDQFSSTGTNPMTHPSTAAQTPEETSSNSPVTTAFSTETTLPASTTSRVDGTFTLNPLETEFSTSFSSSPVSKTASHVSEQTASVGVSGLGPTATNNPSTEEKSFGTSVTITESSLGLTTTIAELSTVTIEPNTQESVTSSSNGTTLNLVSATDLSHSSVHSTAERPSTDTEKSALPVSTILPESTTVASAVTSHFTSKISPQTEVSQMTSTISTVPNTERLPTGTTSSDKTDTESNSPPAFTDKFSSTATNPMTHLITTVQTAGETSSKSPSRTAFSTETTLPVSTTSRVDGTSTLNALETEFSTSFSSSPVSKNASHVSEQTASVGVSGLGPTATNNPSTEETSSGTSVTVTESSLGLTTTIAELSTVMNETNTQEAVTSSFNGTTLDLVTATDLSHSSVHSTAERPSTDTEKSALPVSSVLPDSTTMASAVTSHFTSNISPQTEVSQTTSTISTVPNTERLPTGTTNSDKTDTESNSPPAFTDKFSSIATNPMTHLSTTVQTPAEISFNSPATTRFSSAFTGIDTSFSLTSITPSASSALSNSVQFSTPTDRISANETVMMSSTTAKSIMPITVPNTAITQSSSTFSTPNIAVSTSAGSPTIIPTSPTKTSLTSKSTIILSTIHTATMNSTAEDSTAISVTNAMPLSASTGSAVTAGDTSSKNTKPTIRVTSPEAATVSAITKNTLTQGTCTPLIFSIQLEKVTSEVIQFNWRPQGGRRDSAYTVYLVGNNTVMNTTNQTTITFEDLVPGYEYIISVEVLTCAKKINTSRRVRTEAETFSGKTRITNRDFKPEYNNKSSEEFKDFEKKFIEEIRQNLPPEFQKLLKEGKMRIVIKSLSNGSIIVDFNIIVDVGENITKTELTDAFTEAFTNSSVFQVDLNATFIAETNSCETGLNDCSGNASCNTIGPSYTCQCQNGFTDFSPSVPGRDCRAEEPVTIAPSRQSSTSKSSVKSTSPTPESETAPATSINTTVLLPTKSPSSTSLIYPTTVNATTLMTSSITTTLHATTEVTSPNTESKVTTSNIIPIGPTGNTITTSTAMGKSTPSDKTMPIYTDTRATTETNFSTRTTTEKLVSLLASSSLATKSTSTGSSTNPAFTITSSPLPPGAFTGNSCAGENGCSPHALCTPLGASYTCKCKDGFEDHSPDVPGRDCQDINECAANTSSCSYLATCKNTVGSYDCACNPGMKDENSTNPGRQCKDPVVCFNSTEFCRLQNNDCLESNSLICSSKQVFDCKILFKDIVFVPEFYNSSSEKYQNLAKRITTDVVKKMQIKLGDVSFNIIMVGFRPGSVIAYFVSLIRGQQSIGALQANLSETVKAIFGNQTEVTVQLRNSCAGENGCSPHASCTSIGANYTCKCKDGFEDQRPDVPGTVCQASETNLAWKTAVIVLGVLFGVALLIVLLILSVCLWMKHTSA